MLFGRFYDPFDDQVSDLSVALELPWSSPLKRAAHLNSIPSVLY